MTRPEMPPHDSPGTVVWYGFVPFVADQDQEPEPAEPDGPVTLAWYGPVPTVTGRTPRRATARPVTPDDWDRMPWAARMRYLKAGGVPPVAPDRVERVYS
jgi:hypothetical protein